MRFDEEPTRRDAIGFTAMAAAAFTALGRSQTEAPRQGERMIVCFIRYQVDPYQLDGFRKYAENWTRIIPRCGGRLVGYFLPHEGTNDIAWGLIGFDSLASYEHYRERLKSDPESRENFQMAQNKRLILREERTFLELIDGKDAASAVAQH